MQPAAAHFANVAPHPNSTSSGWAPIASAERGTSRSRVHVALGERRLARFVAVIVGAVIATFS